MIGKTLTTNVYWTILEEDSDFDPTPVSIQKKYYENYGIGDAPFNNQNQCPAFNSFLKNTYGLVSIYNFGFSLGEEGIEIPEYFYSQENMEKFMVRDLEKKFFSWRQRYIFFSDSECLNTSFYIPPFFENSFISNNVIPIPGEYDISKWFRNTEFPFYLKNSSFNINCGDIYAYIKFNTQDKIKLKRFFASDEIKDIWFSSVDTSRYKKRTSPINFFYDKFNKNSLREKILLEINKNIY